MQIVHFSSLVTEFLSSFERELDQAFQTLQFDGTHLRLVGKDTHVCDMRTMGIPNQTFT